jgi:hypothetical protein
VLSEAAIKIRRSSSLIEAFTCVMRESKSRAALSARSISFNFAARSASEPNPAIG